jgi:argininosuccinate lyase
VKKGMPFRKAYMAAGALVRRCQEKGITLRSATLELAQSVDPAYDASILSVLEPSGAVARKASAGSTGPAAVEASLSIIETQAKVLAERAAQVPKLTTLFTELERATL